MKMNKTKKGFTIVELVIVIAIIAILAAVLIPTFANLIKRANVSKDNQLVRNLNTALLADKAINGKHETMYSALQAVADSGFDIAKINDKKAADNEILWDSVNDVFCYRDGKDVEDIKYIPDAPKAEFVSPYQYWIIASEPNKTYSTYLYNYKGADLSAVTTGLDVGNENVTSIAYDTHERTTGDSQTVVIRTNSAATELIVNAPSDTVKHYGAVGTVHVIAVDDENCYEENGKAAFTQIDSGKYKTNATAEVELLYVSNAAKVTVSAAPRTVDHAHAYDKGEARTLNAVTTGVTFDYDGNTEQNNATDVQHHVTEGTLPAGQEIAPSLGLEKGADSFETNKGTKVVADVIYNAEAREINAIIVDGRYYKTIGDAFNKADLSNGIGYDISGAHTITLLKDIEDSGLWINKANVNIVIDFNGHSYTITSSVGSTGTTTQAMHFEGKNSKIVLKNGTLTTAVGVDGLKMALQNYINFSAENMTFDLSKIQITRYGTFEGKYEKYSGHECSTFNNNTTEQMVLTNCHLIFPEESKYSIGIGSSIKIINSIIDGNISFQKGETVIVDGTSLIKGMNTYFDGDGKVVSDTTTNPGFTTYTWSEN